MSNRQSIRIMLSDDSRLRIGKLEQEMHYLNQNLPAEIRRPLAAFVQELLPILDNFNQEISDLRNRVIRLETRK